MLVLVFLSKTKVVSSVYKGYNPNVDFYVTHTTSYN